MTATKSTSKEAFAEFVAAVEPSLRRALVASAGPEIGREATADALVYAWKNWNRVSGMGNPAGYLYRVGRSSTRKYRKRSGLFPMEARNPEPWCEPGLDHALERLTERQRTAVLLVDGYGWTFQEVADFMSVSRSAVQRHHDRGMAKLRTALEVSHAS